jgi:hypothetical protein
LDAFVTRLYRIETLKREARKQLPKQRWFKGAALANGM